MRLACPHGPVIHHLLIHDAPCACACLSPCRPPRLQDDEKEAKTTTELLTEAPIEDLMEEKRAAEEQKRVKAALSRAVSKAANDPWDEF